MGLFPRSTPVPKMKKKREKLLNCIKYKSVGLWTKDCFVKQCLMIKTDLIVI